MATCEQCWAQARLAAAWIGGPVDDHYRRVLDRNDGEHRHEGVTDGEIGPEPYKDYSHDIRELGYEGDA